MPKYMTNKVQDLQGGVQTQEQPQEQPSVNEPAVPDEVLYLIQQAVEQTKYELKKEISESLNSKSASLQEVDPTTSACLRACAIAVSGALSSNTPVGGNPEMQQQGVPETESPMKAASSIEDLLYKLAMEKLISKGWLEINQDVPQEKLASDLNDAVGIVRAGLEEYSERYDIDFTDSNTWDLVTELFTEGTLTALGKVALEDE
jgi:hypothetical protein